MQVKSDTEECLHGVGGHSIPILNIVFSAQALRLGVSLVSQLIHGCKNCIYFLHIHVYQISMIKVSLSDVGIIVRILRNSPVFPKLNRKKLKLNRRTCFV